MWVKILITIILFYLFAVLQNSFFVHFNLFGAVPNLVFIFFFLITFFDKSKKYYRAIFYAVVAGLFLDLFSYSYFGVSVIILLLVGFFLKKVQSSLQEKKDNKFPFIYFLPLFIFSFAGYDLLFNLFVGNFSKIIIAEIVYNLFAACIAFYIYRIFFAKNNGNRQLKLFAKA